MSKNSATKSTKSPAKSKLTDDVNLVLQKNRISRKDDTTIEKLVQAKNTKRFDGVAYTELYEQNDCFVKLKKYEKVNDTVNKFEIDFVEGRLLNDIYNDPNNPVSHEMKSLHYYQVLNMYMAMQTYSKKKAKEEIAKIKPDSTGKTHPIAAARAEWTNKVFFHKDITPTNIICTPNEELILIDIDSFVWDTKVSFAMSIMSRYSIWLDCFINYD